ncbi:unnamed protein product, partial [Phaeothamnion confervicola]
MKITASHRSFFLALFCFLSSFSEGQLPPPLALDAGSFSVAKVGECATVSVDLFLDIGCSDCAESWHTLSKVMESYGADGKVSFQLHLLPLPYHRWAFLAAKAAQAVKRLGNPSGASDDIAVLRFLALAFAEQRRILNDVTEDLLVRDVQAILAGWAMRAADVAPDAFDAAMDVHTDTGSRIEDAARRAFKYAGLRGVYGTPWAIINGVPVPGLGDGSREDWDSVLAPLLAAADS